MDDLIILKAQFEALRNYFTSLLPVIFEHDERQSDKVWLAKYFLWRFERENLFAYSSLSLPASPETERIDHRRFQLQVLMDVAYIRGHLEEFDIFRRISCHSFDLAKRVYDASDGSEESMLPLIDKL